MNDDDVTTVLGRVVPEPPSPDAWAGKAARTSRRRRISGVAAVAVLALVAVPLGAQLFAKPQLAAPASPSAEVTGNVLIRGSAEAPVLCLGGMMESLPPQCSGPALKGPFDWAGVQFTEASGVRWTDKAYTVRGIYDPTDGEYGSFTLTAPVALAPEVQPSVTTFPQLCDDPMVGAPPGTDPLEQQAFAGALDLTDQKLPVVSSWATDGGTYNYLVQGDAEAAFAEMRAVFDGGLCVQSSDAPTYARRMAALDAVAEALAGQYVGGDISELPPELTVTVVVATPQIEAAVRAAAGEVPFTLHPVFAPVAQSTPSSGPTTTASDSPPVVRTVTGTERILQKEGELPRLCVKGMWEATEPVSCDGPTLDGDIDWDAIPHTTDQGVLVSDQHYTVTGAYDASVGNFGSLTLDGPPVAAGLPGVAFERYSTLCTGEDGRDDPRWPPIVIAPSSEDPIPLPDPQGWVCSHLTGAVADDKLDAVLGALPSVRDPRIVGYARDGNDLVVKVLAADDALMDLVYAAVEETRMPVAVRTALTPPGENDTTIVAPSR
ncbi:MAG: hypothetical protein QM713_10455 [Arachnia sp.]